MNPTAGPQLRDIHMPPPPSWWPPAPGWWLLAIVLLAVCFLLLRWTLRRVRARRWRRRARAELARIAANHAQSPDPLQLSTQLSLLLRRASLLIEPHAAALRGEAWLDFLDRQLPAASAAATPFRSGPGRMLIDAPFRAPGDPAVAYDAHAVLALARSWLDAVLTRTHAHA